ncbi:metal ABC transporter solute-binding protein, Zn/Mn family, partial [Hydrocoleum sp. CS-953]|uniref:metal ABC transporter solute-binding protein, Zn/Mn family n=1 Tax=Hydrocoleum sp. CS-953 TaxID=1671698 RepID=UPI00143DF048
MFAEHSLYEKAQLIQKISEKIFVNGLGFETWSQTLIENSGTKAKVLVATEGVTPLKVEGETDPHAWNALTNGQIYVANIAEVFGLFFKGH